MRTTKSFRKIGGAHIGRMSKPVHVCERCECPGVPGVKPVACVQCGGLAFMRFDSTGEAGRYATLRLLERAGQVSDIRRQVRFDLMAWNAEAQAPVKVAVYVCDFVYTQDGKTVREDFKAQNVMSDVADLKLKFMSAMNLPVKLTT